MLEIRGSKEPGTKERCVSDERKCTEKDKWKKKIKSHEQNQKAAGRVERKMDGWRRKRGKEIRHRESKWAAMTSERGYNKTVTGMERKRGKKIMRIKLR